jgi:hypothetical protein
MIRKLLAAERTVAFVLKGEEAFNMECEFGDTALESGKPVCALVQHSITGLPDGTQRATIKVASADGGFLVTAETRAPNKLTLQPGDLILWIPHIQTGIGEELGTDPRFGIVGLIAAKVELHQFKDGSSAWKCLEKY